MSRRSNHRRRLGVLLRVGLCLVAPIALAQGDGTPNVGELVQQRVNQIRRQGETRDNPLADLIEFEELDAQYKSAPGYPANMVLTMLYETHSFLGNHAASLRAYDERYDRAFPDYLARKKQEPAESIDFTDRQAVAALAALDELADTTRVVMINEAHHVPRHRHFTQQALTLLRKKGFGYFAAEAFGNEDAELGKRGYPILSTGRYTREPMFGELVRTAIREGYELIAYEGPLTEGPDERERGQARNLIERVLERDPKAKLVIHAGYSHINEQGERKWMAHYFKQWSGIDPLTIDQTSMSERSSPEYEVAGYVQVLKKYDPSQPIVLRDSTGTFWSAEPGNHDLTVIHPRTTYQNGRPTWLAERAGRQPYMLPKKICGRAKVCLVQARFATESDAAIAIDQIEVKADQRRATLMLPVGEFKVLVQDGAGVQLRRLEATIRTRARK